MTGFLSGVRGGNDASFDTYDEFVPAHIPDPGSFLTDHEVLTGRDHAAVHRLARLLFEERGVYDVTFGYNLARLNLDRRHPDAGYRYAIESDDRSVLRAEFTPTTEFCPQSDTLATGSFRAFNGERDRHQFDIVNVRVDETHHQSLGTNERLQSLEETFSATDAPQATNRTDGAGSGGPDDHEIDAPF